MMDAEIAKELFLPWWKIPVYALVVALAITTVRIGIKFDVNVWIAARRSNRVRRERMRFVEECVHTWTLYPTSQYSICNKCMAYIATATLFTARELGEPKPVIIGERHGVDINPGEGSVLVVGWTGGSRGMR